MASISKKFRRAGVASCLLLAFAAVAAPAAPSAPSDSGNEARLREDYLGGQFAASMFAYGFGLVNTLRPEGKANVFLPTVAVTGALAGHMLFFSVHPLSGAQITGMNGAAGGAILASYAVPVAFTGIDEGSIRLGSAVSLLAYPLALAPGYRLGTAHEEQPGVFSKRVRAAGLFAGFGAALPWAYYRDIGSDAFGRTMAIQGLALGATGYFAADLWRPGEEVPDGAFIGVMTHTVLGSLVGTALWASFSPSDRVIGMRYLLGATTAGFAEGLVFFHDRDDDTRRAIYAGAGLSGVAYIASAIGSNQELSPAPMLWVVSGGAIAGYVIGYSIVSQDSPGRAAADDRVIRRASLQLAPVPEAVRVADTRTGRESWDVRYRVPGLVVRF